MISQKVTRAEDMLAEALARAPKATGKRRIQPGMLIRYWFHGLTGNPPEAALHQGNDVVELLRTREPRVFLQRMKQWVFTRDCMILPEDSLHARRLKQHKEKLAEAEKQAA